LRAENNLLSVSIANQRPSPSATLHIPQFFYYSKAATFRGVPQLEGSM